MKQVLGTSTARGLYQTFAEVLTEREAFIFRRWYALDGGEKWNFRELGEHFDITCGRAAQLRMKAQHKLQLAEFDRNPAQLGENVRFWFGLCGRGLHPVAAEILRSALDLSRT